MEKRNIGWKWLCYAAGLLLLIGLVAGGFLQKEQAVYQVSSGELARAEDAVWRSEAFSLPAGVYRMEVQGTGPEGAKARVSVENGNARVFRELLTETVHVMPEAQEGALAVGTLTVTSGMDAVYLQVAAEQASVAESVREITLIKTGKLYWVLAVCLLLLWVPVMVLLWMRTQSKAGGFEKETHWSIWGIAGAAVLSLFPNLTDYLTLGTDTLWYLAQTEKMAFGGEGALELLYLRIPAFLRSCGFTMQTSWQIFLWSVTLVTAVSAYLWLKACWKNQKIALLLTLLFLFWPMRITLLYEQGQVSGWVASSLVLLVLGAAGLLGTSKVVAKIKSLSEKKLVWKNILVVATLVSGLVSFYRLNDLAFHMAPVYLYGYPENGGEELIRTVAEGKSWDLAANAALLFDIAVLAAWGVRALWVTFRIRSKAAGRRKP